ncbi:hypothetical protein QR680_010334 [Steinernema hermaphroditum]|uniref:Uncharacterized protein n=1 Tax=Steinernema hermaphroditum TaxID=289476 RepID=A0AA39IQ18_9BILA|nr:hypothetical protein QR680_010334 [Steinernema hermaphroditum]
MTDIRERSDAKKHITAAEDFYKRSFSSQRICITNRIGYLIFVFPCVWSSLTVSVCGLASRGEDFDESELTSDRSDEILQMRCG